MRSRSSHSAGRCSRNLLRTQWRRARRSRRIRACTYRRRKRPRCIARSLADLRKGDRTSRSGAGCSRRLRTPSPSRAAPSANTTRRTRSIHTAASTPRSVSRSCGSELPATSPLRTQRRSDRSLRTHRRSARTHMRLTCRRAPRGSRSRRSRDPPRTRPRHLGRRRPSTRRCRRPVPGLHPNLRSRRRGHRSESLRARPAASSLPTTRSEGVQLPARFARVA